MPNWLTFAMMVLAILAAVVAAIIVRKPLIAFIDFMLKATPKTQKVVAGIFFIFFVLVLWFLRTH